MSASGGKTPLRVSALPPLGGGSPTGVAPVSLRRRPFPVFATLPTPRVAKPAPAPAPGLTPMRPVRPTAPTPAPPPSPSPLALRVPGERTQVGPTSIEPSDPASPPSSPSSVEDVIARAILAIEGEMQPSLPRKVTVRFGTVLVEVLDQMSGNLPLREVRLRLEGKVHPSPPQEALLEALVARLGAVRKVPTDERGVALYHGPIPTRPASLIAPRS